MSEKIKVWIDTDMGGDIDDALTISMALHSKEIQVMGISAVYIANEWRTGIIKNMLKAYGREEIPVGFGAERPINGRWSDEPDGNINMPNQAIEMIIKAARENPGLVILAIGPLTNIALALLAAPDIIKNIKLYIMGGMVGRATPEWNILCDPEGARAVLESGADITMIGLDVTEKCRLSEKESIDLVRGDDSAMTFLRGEMERFLTSFDFLPTLHDPLTLAALLWEELFVFEQKEIRIETRGEFTRGVTIDVRYTKAPNVRYAIDVQAKLANEKMCRRVRGEG